MPLRGRPRSPPSITVPGERSVLCRTAKQQPVPSKDHADSLLVRQHCFNRHGHDPALVVIGIMRAALKSSPVRWPSRTASTASAGERGHRAARLDAAAPAAAWGQAVIRLRSTAAGIDRGPRPSQVREDLHPVDTAGMRLSRVQHRQASGSWAHRSAVLECWLSSASLLHVPQTEPWR